MTLPCCCWCWTSSFANAPEAVREEQVARAINGTAQLDQDLARLRELLGARFDQMRDRLPELLERYGDLRDSRAVKSMLRDWRTRRLRSPATTTEDEGAGVEGAPPEPVLN